MHMRMLLIAKPTTPNSLQNTRHHAAGASSPAGSSRLRFACQHGGFQVSCVSCPHAGSLCRCLESSAACREHATVHASVHADCYHASSCLTSSRFFALLIPTAPSRVPSSLIKTIKTHSATTSAGALLKINPADPSRRELAAFGGSSSGSDTNGADIYGPPQPVLVPGPARTPPVPGADTFPNRDQLQYFNAAAPAGAGLSYGSLAAAAAAAAAVASAGHDPSSMYAPPPCNPSATAGNAGRGGHMQQQHHHHHHHHQAGLSSCDASSSSMRGSLGGPLDSDAYEQHLLPESTPAPVADPAEASMLAIYLRLVRETHGHEAAAVAASSAAARAAATGTASGTATPTPPYLSSAYNSYPSSRPPSADTQRSDAAAAAGLATMQHLRIKDSGSCGGSDSPSPSPAGGGGEVVSSMLGFIRERKLATNNPSQRRTSLGGESTGSNSSGASKGSMKIWIQPSGEWHMHERSISLVGGKGRGARMHACMAVCAHHQTHSSWNHTCQPPNQPKGPRRPGEGTEDEEQGILTAEEVPASGDVMLRITLLAAGFVIGGLICGLGFARRLCSQLRSNAQPPTTLLAVTPPNPPRSSRSQCARDHAAHWCRHQELDGGAQQRQELPPRAHLPYRGGCAGTVCGFEHVVFCNPLIKTGKPINPQNQTKQTTHHNRATAAAWRRRFTWSTPRWTATRSCARASTAVSGAGLVVLGNGS